MRRATALVVALAAVAFAGLFVVGPLGEPACASQATEVRMDLRVLLVSTDGEDEATAAWRDLFADEGVPHDEVLLEAGDELRASTLRRTDGGGRYQAIVLADSHLGADGRPDVASLLDDEARLAIDGYQRDTGARLVAGVVVPDAALPVTVAPAPVDLDDRAGRVTDAGRDVFPYLVGDVPVEGAFGFVPTAASTGAASITTLVALPGDRPLVFVARGAGGTETLYLTPQISPSVLHWRLLRHGLLGWATGGVHVGLRRLHYAMQVDDIFLPNFRWDVEQNQTRAEAGTSLMTPDDYVEAARWSRDNDLRLDMVFNASGRTRATCEVALRERDAFGWANHTYTHRDLDDLPLDQLVEEIELNRRWAENHELPGFAGDELITGAHTGLENPAMPEALRRTGIEWIASDASREPQQRRLGGALTVPRYPTDIYYDTSTRAEQLDEYDYVYLESCDASSTTCRDEPVTWLEFVRIQAELMFRHIIDGDPRIHYSHQSNLTDDRVLYEPLEAMLDRYRSLVAAPLLQPTLTDSGSELRRQDRWAAALERGDVEVWRTGDEVHVLSSTDVEVPLTGMADAGPIYAGEAVGWVPVRAGEELVLSVS